MERLPPYVPSYKPSAQALELNDKVAETQAAGLEKRAELADITPAEQLLREFNADVARVSAAELRSLYGSQMAAEVRGTNREAQRQEDDALRSRTPEEIGVDAPLSVLRGAVNLVGGVPLTAADVLSNDKVAPGMGGTVGAVNALLRDTDFREEILSPATALLGDFNKWADENSSRVKQADSAIMSRENLEAAAGTQAQYDAAVEAGASPLVEGGKQIGRDLANDFSNMLEHPTVLGDTVVEQLPTLGLGVAAKAAISTEAIAARAAALALRAEAKAAAAGQTARFAAADFTEEASKQLFNRTLPGMVGATEAGSAYGQSAGEILDTDIEVLRERFPSVKAALEQYGPDQVPADVEDRIKSQLASDIGLTTAAITLPIATAAGRLGAGFQRDPIGIGKAVNAVTDVGGELAEEGIQGAASEAAGNVARVIAGDEDQRLLEGVGGAAGQGIAAAAGTTAALRGPRTAADLGITAGKMTIGALMKRGQDIQAEADAIPAAQRAEINTANENTANTVSEAVLSNAPDVRATAPAEVDPILSDDVKPIVGTGDRVTGMARALTALNSDQELTPEQKSNLNLFVLKTSRELRQDLDAAGNPELSAMSLAFLENDQVRAVEQLAQQVSEEELAGYLSALPDDVIPEGTELSPKIAQLVEQVKELAFIVPDKIGKPLAMKVLAQKGRLRPEEVKQLELALEVATVKENHEAAAAEIKKRFPNSKTGSQVRHEINEAGFDTGKGVRLSLTDYVRNVSQAATNGNIQTAKILMGKLQEFSQHMNRRADSFDRAAINQVAAGTPKNKTFTVDVGGTLDENGKLDQKTKFELNITNDNSLAVMDWVFADANTVAETYNTLAKQYPQIVEAAAQDQVPLVPSIATNLAPTYDKLASREEANAKPAAVVPVAAVTAVEPEPAPVTTTPEAAAPSATPAEAPTATEEAPKAEPAPTAKPVKTVPTVQELVDNPREDGNIQRGRVRIDTTNLTYDILPEGVRVNIITTPKADRGKGTARKVMNEFLRQVDEANLPSLLTVEEQDSATALEGLIKFYKSVGYVEAGFTEDGSIKMTRPAANAPAVDEEVVMENATTVAERFPGLVEFIGEDTADLSAQEKYQRTNKLTSGFSLAKKSRALFARMVNPIENILKALETSFATKDFSTFMELYEPEHRFMQPDQGQMTAMVEVMDAFVPQVVENLNKMLMDRMTTRATPKSQTILERLLDPSKAEWQYGNRLSLHAMEWGTENGVPFIRYQPEIAQGMALAALNWATGTVNNPILVDKEKLAKAYPDGMSPELLEAYSEGYFYVQPIRTIAADITNLLGITANSDLSVTYSDGLPKALAQDVLQALEMTGAISIKQVAGTKETRVSNAGVQQFNTLSFVVFNQDANDNNWTNNSAKSVKPLADRFKGRTLLTRLLYPDSQELPTFGEASQVVPTTMSGTRQSLSTAQMNGIKNANNIPFFANLPFINMIDALGEDNLLSLLGYRGDDLAPLNVNHRRQVEGINQGLDHAIKNLREIYTLWQAKAEESGKSMGQIPAYFSRRIISNGRMMMNGFGPQSDKIARETISAVKQELDLRNNEEHKLAFKLSIAQALGKKTEKLKNFKAAQEITDDLTHPAFMAVFASLGQLQQMDEGADRDALAQNITNQIRGLMNGSSGALKIPDTARAINALSTYAQYLDALNNDSEEKFESYLAFELDGKTDGPINAIAHFGLWMTDPIKAITQLRKGGWFINQENPMTLSDDPDTGDLYQDTASVVQDKVRNGLATLEGFALQRLAASVDLLTKIRHFKQTETEHGIEITVLRENAKGALMTTTYGAGKRTVIGVMAYEIMDYVNEQLSKALEDEVQLDQNLQNALRLMMSAYRDRVTGKWIKIAPPQLNNMRLYKGNMFNSDHVRALIDNLGTSAGGMLTGAVASEMAPVLGTFQSLYKISAFQSWALKRNFTAAYEKLRKQRVAEGKLGPKDALSRKDEQAIMKDLAAQVPAYALSMTGGNTEQEGINVVEKDYDGQIGIEGEVQGAGSLFGKLWMDINSAQITNPGVRAAALLTIAAGDASMMTDLQNGDPDGTLDVYDGWEIGPAQLFARALEVNTVVHKNWQFDVLGSVEKSMNGMELNIGELTNEEVAELAEYIKLDERDDMDFTEMRDSLSVLLNDTKRQIVEKAKDTRINKQIIATLPNSTDHMSGGERPFFTSGEVQTDLVEYFAQKREELDPRINVPTPTIDTKLVGSNEGELRVLTRDQVFNLAYRVGFKNPVRKFVFGRISKLLPKTLVVYSGTPAQIEAKQRELFPNEDFGGKDNLGSYYSGVVFVKNGSEETLLHELVHAATYELILQFYADEKGLSFNQKEGIRALDILTHEFAGLDISVFDDSIYHDIASAQQAVLDHLNEGNIAEAVNEFMAWSMTNEAVQTGLNKTTGSVAIKGLRAIAKKIAKIVRQLLGLPLNNTVETFLEQALQQFDRVTRRNGTSVARAMPLFHSMGPNTVAGPHEQHLRELGNQFEQMRNNLPRDGRVEVQVMAYANDAIIDAVKIRDAFINAGFVFTQSEQYAFDQLQALFASTIQLDANSLAAMQNIYNTVMPQLKVEDFLADPLVTNATAMAEAKARFDALKGVGTTFKDPAGRSNQLANFIGLALVNESFRTKLGGIPVTKPGVKFDSLDQWIRDSTTKAFDWMSSTATLVSKARNQQEAINLLVARLYRNQQAAVKRANVKDNVFSSAENKVTGFMKEVGNKADTKLRARVAANQTGGLDGWINTGLNAVRGMSSEEGATAIGEQAISWVNESNFPTPLRELIAEVVGIAESNYPVAQLLNQVKHAVSRVRQRLREEVPGQVRALFTTEIDAQGWKTLHRAIGKTDMQVLFGAFSGNQLRRMLQDPAQLQATIARLENQLGTHAADYAQAAQDLGRYMVTGENHSARFLYRNADAMVRLLGTGLQISQEEIDALTPLVDQLTTLRAVEALESSERAFVAGLLETDRSGMESLLRLMRSLNRAEFSKPDYRAQAYNRWKGYVPASLDPRNDLTLATPAEGARLVLQGYQRLGAYQGDFLDPSRQNLSYYAVSWSGGQATYNQGAMQTVEGSVGGVDRLTGRTLDPQTKTMITYPQTVERITMSKLTGGFGGTRNLLPVFDVDGLVVAYERPLDKSLLDQHLVGNVDLSKSIGMWMGRQAEESIALEVNTKLVEKLKTMWDEEKDQRAGEFVDVSAPNSKVTKEAWDAIPRETQDLLKNAFERDPVMVRKDMLNNALGYRSASVANVFAGMTDLPESVQKAIRDTAYGLLGKRAYQVLVVGERGWQSLISTAKDIIVVRSGVVALANGLANQFQLVQMGVPPTRLLQSQAAKVRETETFLRNEKRLAQLQFDKSAAVNPNILAQLEREQKVLEDANSRLSIWPLIQAGELPSIAEGLSEQDEYTLMKDLTGWLEDKVKDVPQGLITTAKYAMITKDTALYLGLNRAIQFGDFMAKSVAYDLLIEQGMTQEAALKEVNESFVNYNLLAGRSRDYLESIGMTWFLNYKLRIQKIVLRTLRKNPLRFLMAGIGGDVMGVNSLVDSSAPSQNWGYAMGPGQLFRAHDMLMWTQLTD